MIRPHSLDFENPWVFVTTMVVLWIVIWSLIELLLFEGDLASVLIPATAGGLAFGLATFYSRQKSDAERDAE